MDKKLFSTFAILALLFIATIAVIAYARGYRYRPQTRTIQPTGLLAATSLPTGASIYINDRLTSATNTTINLPPGEYKVRITKEGLIPWEKTLKIESEVVTRADPILFPLVPDLRRLTFLGADKLVLSPDGQKITFSVESSDSPQKSGLWVLDMGGQTFVTDHTARLVAANTQTLNFSKAVISWSPDSKQILASFKSANYLLDSNGLNSPERLLDVTATLPLTIADWQSDLKQKSDDLISKLKNPIQKIASNSAVLNWSPDETKFMYITLEDNTIPQVITPPLIGTNSQPEIRKVKPGAVYVYDIKEDKNFEVMSPNKDFLVKLAPTLTPKAKPSVVVTPSPQLSASDSQFSVLGSESPVQLPVQWLPSSRHLILVEKDKISIMDYDGTNKATVYAGPFVDGYVFPWPDGGRLVILTSLNQAASGKPNLYSINLR